MHSVAKPKWDAVNHKWDQPFLPSVQQYIILLEESIEELETSRETSRISFYFNNKEISKEKAKELLEENNIKYTMQTVGQDLTPRDLYNKIGSYKIFPQIIYEGNHLKGGYPDLVGLLGATKVS